MNSIEKLIIVLLFIFVHQFQLFHNSRLCSGMKREWSKVIINWIQMNVLTNFPLFFLCLFTFSSDFSSINWSTIKSSRLSIFFFTQNNETQWIQINDLRPLRQWNCEFLFVALRIWKKNTRVKLTLLQLVIMASELINLRVLYRMNVTVGAHTNAIHIIGSFVWNVCLISIYIFHEVEEKQLKSVIVCVWMAHWMYVCIQCLSGYLYEASE